MTNLQNEVAARFSCPLIRRVFAPTCLALFAATVLTVVVQSQSADAQLKARAAAFFEALASGSAEKFEAMASENYTPTYLARLSPERRKALFDRIQSDFGQLTLTKVEVREDAVVLYIRGATGFSGRIDMDIEPKPPYRIIGFLLKADKASALPPPPINASMPAEELGKAIDAYFGPLVRADKFAGVVLLAKDGSAVVERAYGLADREAKVPIVPETRFNLGSINKIFTKTAIAQLTTEGKLALTDTVGKLLPDHPNEQARTATVAQLLDHRAGVADFFGPQFDAAPKTQFRSNADYYRFVAGKPLLFAPGEKMQYCNGCYVVLGAIIERVAGVPFEQYISERVFKLAGMKTAGFFQSDHFPPHVAVGYTLRAPASPNVLQSNVGLIGASGSAAGGAYATAADLLAFDSALREGRLLNPQMTAWMLLVRVEAAKGRRAGGELGIAGGAPGINAAMESDGTWTVVVVGNLDPPSAEQACIAIARQLRR